jgi:hypothetical protein
MTNAAERYIPTLADPFTVRQLKQIKPGEKITYYKGDFSKDIDTNAAVKLGSEEPDLLSCHQWTNAYTDVLRAIRRTAAQLARDGLVALSVTEHKKKMTVQRRRKGEPVTEVEINVPYNAYHAVGLRRGNVIPLPTLTEIERDAEISLSSDNPPNDSEAGGTRILEHATSGDE